MLDLNVVYLRNTTPESLAEASRILDRTTYQIIKRLDYLVTIDSPARVPVFLCTHKDGNITRRIEFTHGHNPEHYEKGIKFFAHHNCKVHVVGIDEVTITLDF